MINVIIFAAELSLKLTMIDFKRIIYISNIIYFLYNGATADLI